MFSLPFVSFFLVFCFFLFFFAFFPSFPGILRGFSRKRNPCSFRGVLVFFLAKKARIGEKELKRPKIRKIPAHIKIKSALPPPLPKKTPNHPPPKTRNFTDMGVFLQKEAIFPGAHKIGTASSGPRTAGKHLYGHEDLSDKSDSKATPRAATPERPHVAQK